MCVCVCASLCVTKVERENTKIIKLEHLKSCLKKKIDLESERKGQRDKISRVKKKND